jgi:hypothetical protein
MRTHELQSHYHEVVNTICRMFIDVFRALQRNHAAEIAAVNKQYPAEPFEFLDPPLILPLVSRCSHSGAPLADSRKVFVC